MRPGTLILSLFWAAWHIPLFSFAMGHKSMGLSMSVPGRMGRLHKSYGY